MREQNDEDRREVYLQITDEGERTLRRLSASHWEEIIRQGPALADALEELLGHPEQELER